MREQCPRCCDGDDEEQQRDERDERRTIHGAECSDGTLAADLLSPPSEMSNDPDDEQNHASPEAQEH